MIDPTKIFSKIARGLVVYAVMIAAVLTSLHGSSFAQEIFVAHLRVVAELGKRKIRQLILRKLGRPLSESGNSFEAVPITLA